MFNANPDDEIEAQKAEMAGLATSIMRTVENHWGYILINHSDAMHTLSRLANAKVARHEDLSAVNENLRTIASQLDDRLTDATYLFKEIWEAVGS